MRKIAVAFLFSFFFFFINSSSTVLAQNKAGIHIGDHFNDFDKAAGIVGRGGWVVVMACPGDTDKIALMIAKHPEVNIIIRGHYPGMEPNQKLAKLWAASLESLPTPNKIYFMPWNEPNQAGSADWGEPSVVVSYIRELFSAFSRIKGRKVDILSPMLNRTWVGGTGDFDNYVGSLRSIQSNFFSQFDGIALNLYDIADECGRVFCSNNPHYNALRAAELLAMMGAVGKPVYGVEAGTAGNNFYFKSPASSSSPLYVFTNTFLRQTSARMFALPAYDLGGEAGHNWSLFSPADVVSLLRSATRGGTTPNSLGVLVPTLRKCTGKNYSFYLESETECSECGSMVSACKPIDFGNLTPEKSKNSVNIPQSASYDCDDPQCLSADFSGKYSLENFEIPFANDLNKYFLGPYVDNLKARVEKKDKDPFLDSGVFEKLTPKAYQDDLRLRFIDEVVGRGVNSRYFSFRIEGQSLSSIASQFRAILIKIQRGENLTSAENSFLLKVWPQVPLFANEESLGEIVFYASGIDQAKNKLKTSVPEVYRLNKVTEQMSQIFRSDNSIPGEQTLVSQVLPAQTASCNETGNVPVDVSNKETLSGPGDEICTSQTIQEKDPQLEGNRTYINDARETCKDVGISCSYKDQCCGQGKKCGFNQSTGVLECQDNICGGGYCDYGGQFSKANCCVPDCPTKDKPFTDTNLNSINRVPFLQKIADNTVGASGFFRTWVSKALNDPYNPIHNDAELAFREVAGESNAQLLVDINRTSVNGGSFTVNSVRQQLSLLFYKLGTLINAKNFVSGELLWPKSDGTGGPPNPIVPTNLTDFFKLIGTNAGVPWQIIEAVMLVESPYFFSLPENKINQYLAGTPIENCGPNECSATGPMQITTGRDHLGSPACSTCCYPTCLTQCPNAWSANGCGGSPCILTDNVSCGAKKLKHDSGASSATNWTQEQVFSAIRSYYGECTTSFPRLGNKTYCQYVWDYYQTH